MPKSLLVIRFSAIGDLLLSAPVLQAMAHAGTEIDLLVKSRNAALCSIFPYVRSVRIWEQEQETIINTANTTYDAVLDLQGTRQSKRFTSRLKLPTATFKKPYLQRALLLWTKHSRFALTPVVERYFNAAQTLYGDQLLELVDLPEFRLPNYENRPTAAYVVAVIGGSQEGKRLCTSTWKQLLNALKASGQTVVLLGGPAERTKAKALQEVFPEVLDATDNSVTQGLSLVKNAALVISGDTGFMHAAALMNRPLVSFWGATHPYLGFAPWPKRENQREVFTRSRWTPLHKHGKVPFWAKNPMKKMDVEELTTAIAQMLQGKTTP